MSLSPEYINPSKISKRCQLKNKKLSNLLDKQALDTDNSSFNIKDTSILLHYLSYLS